jgi:N-acetylneuraminate synthase
MDVKECRELISESKRMKNMRGGSKGAVPEEQVTIDFAYASVVTIKDIKAGDILSEDNIWVKRPGTGYWMAEDFESLMGKVATEDIINDSQLKKDHVK